jgi:hypothetical protein
MSKQTYHSLISLSAYQPTWPKIRIVNFGLTNTFRLIVFDHGRLGGVMVSVLATGPKGCGFKTRPRRWILRAIKILSTPSSRKGNREGKSHVRFYGM